MGSSLDARTRTNLLKPKVHKKGLIQGSFWAKDAELYNRTFRILVFDFHSKLSFDVCARSVK
jgi:hypothetical protein